MFDDHYCSRCGQGFKWEQMTSTPAGNLFCPECWRKFDPSQQPTRKCPVDGVEMKKRLVADLVLIDTCSKCEGIWFDKGELDVIKKKSKDTGWNQGFVLGMVL